LRYFQYYTFGQTEPVGDDGAIAQLNFGYLRTRPRNGLPTGDAKTGQLIVSYPLIRSFGENLILSGSFDALDSENALLGQTFANEKVRAVRVSSAWSLQTETRTMNAALTVSLGIKGFGARVASPITSQNAFTKFNLQAAFAQQISGSWIVRLSGVGQYSSARLPVSEFIALGGGNCVRGFPAASIYGDTGAAGSVELAYRFNGFGSIAEFSHKMEMYVFADEGAATLNLRPGLIKRGYSLSSAGIGTRLWLGLKTSLYIEAEKRIHVPVGISDLDHTWQLDFGLQGGF
jgi:hemolysin activation/secretion protein